MKILIAAALLAALVSCQEMPGEKTYSIVGEWVFWRATAI